MEPFRLKLKVGPHEFEAEGDQESVEKQLAIWRDLIGSPAASAPLLASPPPAVVPAITPPAPSPAVVPESRAEYDRLFRHGGRVVSLTVLPSGANRDGDAALLILLGQKVYNGDDQVTGMTINDGLQLSGIKVARIDRVWGEHWEVNVIRSGAHRGTRYRLTHPGMARARELAAELLKLVP